MSIQSNTPAYVHRYSVSLSVSPDSDDVINSVQFGTRPGSIGGVAEFVLDGSSGPDFYLVNSGDAFSRHTIANQDHLLIGGWQSDRPHIDVETNNPFYVASDLSLLGHQFEFYGWFEVVVDDDFRVTFPSSGYTALNDQVIVGEYVLSNGDIGRDGIVNATDLNILAGRWQQDAYGVAQGDLTGDRIVDAADLNIIGLNWQRGVPVASVVPEPSFQLWPLLLLALSRRRWVEISLSRIRF